jgi:hypothetical protein
MTPPSKWLFFPSPAASAGIKLEVDFTLVAGGDGKFDGSSPTWSGTDAGSPDNYALNVFSLKKNARTGNIMTRLAFGGSGNYPNNMSDWLDANGSSVDDTNSKLTNDSGTVLSTASVSLLANPNRSFMQLTWNKTDTTSINAFWDSLTAGDSFNMKIDW